jgi:predicted RNA-binding protein with PUA-like domain
MQRYWLLKSEPHVYSIENLEQEIVGRWDGVRNHQAKNFIKIMQPGDIAYFYHSSCATPGIYGRMLVEDTASTDPTALDPESSYFESRRFKNGIPWLRIHVRFKDKLKKPLTLKTIRILDLGDCPLTARRNRLSVIPLTPRQFQLLESIINTPEFSDQTQR